MSKSSKAIILIGGPSKGTRFRPLSLGVPKPLFPIANKPMIYHHIESCVDNLSNLKEIILLGFFDINLFKSFIEETEKEFNIPIKYFKEDTRLGTAGGLYKFRDQICSDLENESTLFIFNCDVLAKFPLKELDEFHNKHGHLCTLLTKQVEQKDAKNYGCVVSDKDSNEILHYAEKPETFVSNLVNCGVYLFSMDIFNTIASIAETKPKERSFYDRYYNEANTDDSIKIRLEQDVFRHLAGNKQIYSYEYKGYWCPVKHPSDALKVSLMLIENADSSSDLRKSVICGNVLVDPSACVDETSRIGDNVSIAKNVKIGKGVRVKNSIILDGAEIKDRACIINSIIGWRSIVGQWCRIEGTDSKLTILGEGVKTKPEIIIRNSVVLPHKELSGNHHNAILL